MDAVTAGAGNTKSTRTKRTTARNQQEKGIAIKEYEIIILEDGKEVGRFAGNRVIGLVDSREQEEDDAFFGGFDDTVKIASAIGRLVCETSKQATETKDDAKMFIDYTHRAIKLWSLMTM